MSDRRTHGRSLDRERLLRKALHEVRAEDEVAAEDRAWRVVAAATATGTAAPARRTRHRRRAILAALAVGLIALIVSPAGASVRDWVATRIEPGAPRPRPVLSALPGDGSLLVNSSEGPWIVRPDGSKRRLGDYAEASWSPHGLFAVATREHELAAVEPDGGVRWTLARPGIVGKARWNGPDGYRIAYLDSDELRVVDGDGSDDRRIADGVDWVAPAWKPGSDHLVAYATYRDAVFAAAADSGREVLESKGRFKVLSLQWSAGDLLVTRPDRVEAVDRPGRPAWTWAAPPGTRVRSATASPDGERVAIVLHAGGGRSELVLAAPGDQGRGLASAPRRQRADVLFSGPGRFAPPRWSPDGRWLLLSWPSADQWLFLRPGSGPARLHAVASVERQFAPGAASGPFPTVAGWCCTK